jgi:hypothetical protein
MNKEYTKQLSTYLRNRAILTKELHILEAWFQSTDHYPHKITCGEWNETEPRWIQYKADCLIKAARIKELRIEIEGLIKPILE